MNKKIKIVPNSKDSYAKLKNITDLAQSGELRPWGPKVIDIIESYKVKVDRKKDRKVAITLTFPLSVKNRSMAIGIRHIKDDLSFAEDLYLFEENTGLRCYYKGSQENELPEYINTHHAKIELEEKLH